MGNLSSHVSENLFIFHNRKKKKEQKFLTPGLPKKGVDDSEKPSKKLIRVLASVAHIQKVNWNTDKNINFLSISVIYLNLISKAKHSKC